MRMHPVFRTVWHVTVGTCLALLVASAASAQTGGALDPQTRYNRQIAVCNQGVLPEPARNACVRDAGAQLDRATGGMTGSRQVTSPDGRSTVIVPAPAKPDAFGVRPPLPTVSSPSTTTTPDGRATLVNPLSQ
ncbi:hypothetical protein [Polaromonas sp.]|uniref:hypothetical protein n=1 Tax=Polaromonas sp. TaxID=1869339 RepID=UPI002CDAD619|nr:hypothetical protein [Polaromonas sp.]HQS33564.1 hypothetical protein [Polaromonas sp.]HQS89840.1 hypothetical protein [Polaromonas sp.]